MNKCLKTKILVAAVLTILMSQKVYAAASSQGCDSSGNTAAGCSSSSSSSTVGDTIGGTANTNSGSITNNATGGTSTANANNSLSNSGNSYNRNSNSNRNSNTNSVNSSNSNNVSYTNEAPPRNPVSTAYAAPLTASDDTCMGSSSMGGQGVGFGLSFGSTWHDSDCVRRKDARELHNMGHRVAAVALMCQNENVRLAMEAAGEKCPGVTAETASANEAVIYSNLPTINNKVKSERLTDSISTYSDYPRSK